jgi:hypothetical protein
MSRDTSSDTETGRVFGAETGRVFGAETGHVFGAETGHVSDPSPAGERKTTEGRIYTVTGGDWDTFTDSLGADSGDAGPAADERIVINMGPQHPSTHGVLRLVLELEGETVTQLR